MTDNDETVWLGPDIGDATAQALTRAGVSVTRSTGDAADAIERDVAVAITTRPEVPATVRWVHTPMMGVDALVGALPPTVRLVTRTVDGMPARLGSYVATAVSAERWRWTTFRDQQRAGTWARLAVPSALVEPRITILGTGVVGQAIAQAVRTLYADVVGVSREGEPRPGFDRVIPWDRWLGAWAAGDGGRPAQARAGHGPDPADGAPPPAQAGTSRTPDTPDEAPPPAHADSSHRPETVGPRTAMDLATSALVVALPLTDRTRGLVNSTVLSRLDGAHVIIVGRGATVDFDALAEAITTGAVRHATIDVAPVEPPGADSWLWQSPDVTLTPHVAGLTDPSDVVTSFLRARGALRAGQVPPGAVHLTRGY